MHVYIFVMRSIVRVTKDDVEAFRHTRLEALRESPGAFSSRYEDELQFTESVWRDRVASHDQIGSLGLLAMDDNQPTGIVVCRINAVAMAMYQNMGFVPTGRTSAYRNDATLREIEMERRLKP
jgi:hypothetical protein